MAKKSPSKSPGAVSHLLTIIVPLFAVLASWKFLCYVTNSSSPVIVVISESMEPTYHRGDILFLWNNTEAVEVGEVAACWFEGYPLPMVHRVIQKFNPQNPDDEVKFMTKGDNNDLDDRSLYPPGQGYLYRREIIGSVRGYIPYVGHVPLVLQTLGTSGGDFLFGVGKHLPRRLGKYGTPCHV